MKDDLRYTASDCYDTFPFPRHHHEQLNATGGAYFEFRACQMVQSNEGLTMLLSPEDADLFFKLHKSLMCFVNERLQVIPDIETPSEFSSLPPKLRLEVRKAFLDETDRTFCRYKPLRFA